ncbi:MAG: undecaprenyldiphospho-muramoylpentapeptide beta-N-acetylglucosaminyltransferase [Clostridiales bacterium]|nr:undecaprenyldiphospho-muramoylpentapeptide beta-N-acetylglucosaminyltransferase [Clostridiales bacterium]
MAKSIVLTGGGTAGHVMPNIALLPRLSKKFDNIYYIGSKNGIEKRIISNHKNVKYYEVDSAKLARKLTLKNLATPFVIIKSVCQCIKILKEIKPTVIFSKGGYVAVPVVIAGKLLKIPIIAHESDSSIGLANKIIYKFCDTMYFSFKEAMTGYEKKGIYSGSPIRQEFTNPPAYKIDSINRNNKTIVIIGGSLGSTAINKLIISALPKLQDYNVINIVGKGNINKEIQYKNYMQYEFVDNIAGLLQLADVVISRAGSNTIFELLAMNKPMILIPLPKDESRGDQLVNAKIFEKNGWAKQLDQKSTTTDILISEINDLIKNKNKYITNMKKQNKTNAVEIIVSKIGQYV